MKMIPNSLCRPCTCTYFKYLTYIHTKRRDGCILILMKQIESVIKKCLFQKKAEYYRKVITVIYQTMHATNRAKLDSSTCLALS